MAAQITQTLTPPTTAPSRSQDPITFNTNIDNRLAWDATHVTEIETWQAQANTLSTNVNANAVAAEASENAATTSETNAATSAAAAAGSAAFKGLWSSLSGALNMPASVVHNNILWLLNTNSANVAADVPGLSTKWTLLAPQNIQRAREIGGTAYQNIAGMPLAPSFELRMYDYINEVNGFHPQGTVVRASTATYPDEKGVLRTAAADVLRHWWEPNTGRYRGIIVEETATNLVTYSQELDNAAWTKQSVLITADAAVAPDGTTTMDKIIEGATAAEHYVSASAAASAGTFVASVFVKAAEHSWVRFNMVHMGESVGNTSATNFNLSTQVTTGVPSNLISAAGIEDWGGGIFRCWAKYTLSAAATTNQFRIQLTQYYSGVTVYSGDLTSGIYAWGAQVEKLTEMTSYIPTTSATATRAVDSVYFVSTDLTDWLNTVEGTFSITTSINNTPGTISRILDCGLDNNNRFTFSYRNYPSISFTKINAAATDYYTEVDITADISARANITMVMSYKDQDFASSAKGGNLAGNASGSVPSMTKFQIGASIFATTAINGFVTQVTYFPRQISDSLIQVLSA